MKMTRLPLLLASGCFLAPMAAVAHPGSGTGLSGGLVHPLTGLDHLLAMLAIGLLAAQAGGRERPCRVLRVFVAAGQAGGPGDEPKAPDSR